MTTTNEPPGSPTTTTISVKAPHDLIAAAAVVLGFWPSDSVVMLTFGSAQPFHARVDLPDDPNDAAALAELLVAPALHHRVPQVALVFFSDDETRTAPAWRALRGRFASRGVDVVEALRADGRRWYPLLGRDRTLREIGVAYDLEAHPFLAEAVFSGRVTRTSREALAASLDPDPARVAVVEALAIELAGSRACLDALETPVAAVVAEGVWAQTLVERHLRAGSTCTDAEAARLLWGMQQIRVRDAAWSALRRECARPAVAFWTDVVQRCPNWLLAAPATQVAWAAWQAGDGALAWCAIDQALDVDPDYSLATLLGEALTRAIPPSTWDGAWDWADGLDVG